MAAEISTSDWQKGKSLSECLDHVFTSGISSDATFIVGKDKKIFNAHKLILISRSPVFYVMLEGPMAEKGEITIPDITAETFDAFLRYLYTDNIDLAVKNVVSILSVARKYCVDILLSLCEAFLSKHISPENTCFLLEEAHIFTEEKLREECLEVVAKAPVGIINSSTFADLCATCASSITESDDLAVEESDVYDALIRWAGAECVRQGLEVTTTNKSQVLNTLKYNVRFPLIDKDFFVNTVCFGNILPSDEIVEIINYQRNEVPMKTSALNLKKRNSRSKKRIMRFSDRSYWLVDNTN